MSSQI